ncbi:hypothetical protein [Rivularia sp. UHCC 0363]|uniref:hypothetical protein n=1 Tax=Rivularia sp. UHCC 0363 TaxID=3110244 RepID=UPI002B212E54|nr:hypothetical protein [Rivularia sp. UHCC 0363]MEA5598990.1 hypothetical protein [Rivularia sp. UHCC 0363]
MPVLLLSLLLPAGLFACQAINQARRIDKANVQLEKQKFYYAVILSILNALFALFGQIIIENHKHNNNVNKTSEVKATSQKNTKTLSISKNSTTNSTPSNSPISKSSYKSQCPGNSELMSNWKSGQEHPRYPNVIALNDKGKWKPKLGYVFVTKDDPCDLKVKPIPKKSSSNSDGE